MKRILALTSLAVTALCMNQPSVARDQQGNTNWSARERLIADLETREAGPPLSCISTRNLRGNRSIDEDTIVFHGRSRNIVYVNHPPGGCPLIGYGRSLSTRTFSNRLCSGDIVQVFDPTSGFGFGGCALGRFTPYRRVR